MSLAEPTTRRWTKAEYHHLGELGFFKDRRVELINGEIVEMAPQKEQHAFGIIRVDYALRNVFKKGFLIRIQLPLDLGRTTEPEPDIAVVRGSLKGSKKHPKTAALIVEVSDNTLAYDRGRKASLYACAGVKDYWIVNLVARRLEVRRAIEADSAQEFGFGYSEEHILSSEKWIAPLAAPKSKLRVADLLSD